MYARIRTFAASLVQTVNSLGPLAPFALVPAVLAIAYIVTSIVHFAHGVSHGLVPSEMAELLKEECKRPNVRLIWARDCEHSKTLDWVPLGLGRPLESGFTFVSENTHSCGVMSCGAVIESVGLTAAAVLIVSWLIGYQLFASRFTSRIGYGGDRRHIEYGGQASVRPMYTRDTENRAQRNMVLN